MKEIITVINQKGGVGKSTTAGALTTGLIIKGFKVLVIDLDPQCNLTYSFNAKAGATSKDVLTKKAAALDAIQYTVQGDIIPASPELALAGLNLNKNSLKESIVNIKGYDYIIIDTPPALNILTITALAASHSVIIPAQADIYSLQGIGQLYNTIQAIKDDCNPKLSIKGILLTRYNNRSVLSRDITEMIQDTASKLNTIVFNTPIRECIALKEAQAQRQSIYTYAPKSNAATDYTALINEIIERS